MITTSFIWTAFVLQLKATLLGNATWKLLNKTPQKLVNKSIEKIEIGEIDEEESEENSFLYKFSLTILGTFSLIIFEIILAAYLMYENHSQLSYNLTFGLLYKNLIIFAIFITCNNKAKELSFFESINLIPSWALKLDRLSALVSTVIFGIILWHRL